jgi:hypothetical protein
MIHTLGDSHAICTFADVPGVETHTVGPVTMHRAGRPGDELFADAVRALPLTSADLLILVFGEIDCRCHVHAQAALPGRNLDEVVETLAYRYLNRAAALDTHGARVGVLSVTPPTTAARAYNPDFPVTGTDADRAGYTLSLNRRLEAGCARLGLLYIDTNSEYRDESGMLRLEFADWNVHVKDTLRARSVLARMGLL